MLNFSRDLFNIIIGEHGIILTLHKKGKIVNKIFANKFEKAEKEAFLKLFNSNKRIPISILLDTIDQSYKKKDYPFIKKSDLLHLVKKDIFADEEKDAVKNHFILSNSHEETKAEKNRKWHILFINASISALTQEIIDLCSESDNVLNGIYALPLESLNLFKKLKKNINSSMSPEEVKKYRSYCMVTQTKVSGIRQSVFFEDQMIFTRLLDYNSADPNFAKKYEKDLEATSGYIHRIFPEIELSDLETINILPAEAIKQIDSINNIDFHFHNFTPHKASLLASENLKISEKSAVCDLIFSKVFCESKKKILKFSNKRIKIVDKMRMFISSIYVANLAFLLAIAIYIFISVSGFKELEEEISKSGSKKLIAFQNLNEATSLILKSKHSESSNSFDNAEKILDFGKLNEEFSKYEDLFFQSYKDLKFTKNHPVKFDNVNFQIEPFKSERKNSNVKYYVSLKGKILNKSGDIEDLFAEYDDLTAAMKRQYKKATVKYSELPKNIDFTKKYYDYNIEYSIQNRLK